ncbi:amidohydrolase family protein [Fontivita pretiosa]|uniref:amidohydrolase family protein n=1 Tax=Fontivita pretiosa TaxID=2989684 RepID=UPI003D173A4F
MILDCHVHIAACTAGHGVMSAQLLNSIPFRFLRWKFGLAGADESTERALCRVLLETLDRTPELDAAVVLAFDAVYDRHGQLDRARTHLYVSNDYVMDLARQHPKVLFGASVHPYRGDAIAEIERCVAAGAVLLKWLPIVQDFDPSDPVCIPFYEALAHHRLPLLCHTGSEQALPNLNRHVADPILLKPALERGVRVIMAHCGSRGLPWHTDYTPTFMRMAREYEHCYGDTSALSLPTRWYALEAVLRDKVVRQKLIHGSDWPILPLPSPAMLGWHQAFDLLVAEPNWLRRDVLIKRHLDFDDAYWHRAAAVLRLAGVAAVQQAVAPGR